IWLLMLPGWQGIVLADAMEHRAPNVGLMGLVALGAALMRAAGCAYNDIVDRDIDARVARTAMRPIPAGQISVGQAWGFVIACCLASLAILLSLPPTAVALGVASLALVAAYPFMKRITWWPQAWLGLVFSWAALVGWPAVRGEMSETILLLYAGSIFWVIGYDTIYAIQDIEDDALVGVRSSARTLGSRVRGGVAVCYAAALILWCFALWRERPDGLALVALLPMATHLLHQVVTLKPDDGEDALAKFRSNRFAGLLMFLACLVVGTS
ncbi:MAG: 4-hydroxybenzoate polyprenyltransferase, partial [Sphingomonadales bacterium]|nr:4-hydroxybenzoate polyprenyltransferase [Sphingomonadales bacterium]